MQTGITGSIFASERTAWLCVFLYTVVLYSTLTVAFDLYVSLYAKFGRDSISMWMNRSFLAAGVVVLGLLLISRVRTWTSLFAFLWIGVAVYFCLQNLTVPAKRFHFFQYAPLTILVLEALKFRLRDRSLYVWTLVLVTLLGLGDETLQALLPQRHFGLVDVAVNSMAGLLTLAFVGFVIGEENYPWPSRNRPPSKRRKRTGNRKARRRTRQPAS